MKQKLQHLKNLGLESAIVDENASVDGTPAVLLRKDGKEEYYTGFDIPQDAPEQEAELNYREWLVSTFS